MLHGRARVNSSAPYAASFLMACEAGTAPTSGPLSSRRLSGDLYTAPTRPLKDKLCVLLDVILHRMMDFTQAPNEHEFMKQLKKARDKAPK